ncbi:MAG: PQQ-binding-like beta-propeller repeat protein [candidate division WOR-3 bacterium]|nr:PQQ-binding-like beta-propeller repeat protein [candidate division WOR-3 bacterium]MCX7836979.1 PQQ-binding-like beta-propeller repeat protein [candidate division WOR-3 bacterium]MDW8114107.1 PQQ-binding-like beta-propeller repeat protein [candidate division WOR-3 bacterium]
MDRKKRYILYFSILFLILLFGIGCPKNKPPNKIKEVIAPTNAYRYAAVEILLFTTDPNKDDIHYVIDWGDGNVDTTEESFASGETARVTHRYVKVGTFQIKATAKDEKGNLQKEWSDPKSIEILPNEKPTAPVISCEYTSAAKNAWVYFTATANDPDGDSVCFQFIWKRGEKSNWSSFVPSGGIVLDSYQFKEVETYNIKAIAKDKKGGISDTSQPFTITVLDEGYVIKRFYREEVGEEFLSSPAEIDVVGEKYLGVGCSGYGYLYFLKMPNFDKVKNVNHLVGEPDGAVFQSTISCDNSFVYVVENNDVGTHLRILNKADLSSYWNYPHRDSSVEITTAVCVFGSYVAFGCKDTLVILNISNKTVHRKVIIGAEINSAPIENGDNEIIFGANDGKLRKVNLNGDITILYDLGSANPFEHNSPILDNNRNIYVANKNIIISLTPDGNLRWIDTLETDVGQLAIGPDNYLYFGTDGGKIYALSLSDGEIKANYPITITGASFSSAPFFAQDEIFYIYDNTDEKIYCIKLSGEVRWVFSAGEELSKLGKKLEEPEELVSPLIGPDGNIYLGASDGVYAIKGRPTGTPLTNSPWPRWRRNNWNTGSLR